MKAPSIPAAIQRRFSWLHSILENKYYMDWINERILAPTARLLGTGLWKGGDVGVIDNIVIDGSARTVGIVAAMTRVLQSGYLYWYALVMLIGVIGLMTWQLWPYVVAPLSR
jgi:NADH-quinone oxidoreductase subunit L